MSSPPPTRRRIGLGHPNPRAARQVSNNEENERLARENMQEEPEVMPPQALQFLADSLGLDIPGMTSSEDDSDSDDGQGGGPARASATPAPASAAATSARSRTQWENNYPKLNLMARYVRMSASDSWFTKHV